MSSKEYKSMEQYQLGLALYKEKYESERMRLIDQLYAFSLALADVVISHGLADIWVNKTPTLSLREKEIAVLASLITSCTVHSEIKSHAQCMLNVGMTKEEIKEILVLLTLYVGVPKVIVAAQLIEEAFVEYDQARASAGHQSV